MRRLVVLSMVVAAVFGLSVAGAATDSFEIIDVRAAGHPNDAPEDGTRWDAAASERGELSLRPASPVSASGRA